MADQKMGIQFRKKLLIYPRFQLWIIAVNAALMGLGFLVVTFQVYRSFHELRKLGLASGIPLHHSYFKFLDYQQNSLYTYLAIGLLFASFSSWIFTLIFSHRLAGPIVRLKGFFQKISETGEFQQLNFRKGDFFCDLPPIVNSALNRVNPHANNKLTEEK